MIRIKPVLHVYDEEIESQVLCSPSSTVVKFHMACDMKELQNLVKSRLTADEHKVFMDLFEHDSVKRKFEVEKGILIIS
jgi:hypothetical protein